MSNNTDYNYHDIMIITMNSSLISAKENEGRQNNISSVCTEKLKLNKVKQFVLFNTDIYK